MSPYRTDRILIGTLRCAAVVSGLIVAVVALFLVSESVPALRQIGPYRFFTDSAWHPAPHSGESTFNLVPMIVGTLTVTAGALALATPLGLGSAMFLRFYAPPKLGVIYRKIIELLAGIPSVVFGFWGLVTIVPLINSIHAPGASLLAGICILAIMILPTVALVSDAAFEVVPKEYVKGAAALGLSRWATIRGVVIPSAKSGLFTAIILQTGRALGETMAVLMVCGNVVQVPKSVFEPVRTLTANIALEMAYALDPHRSALFVSGLLLLTLVAGLVLLADVLSRRYECSQ